MIYISIFFLSLPTVVVVAHVLVFLLSLVLSNITLNIFLVSLRFHHISPKQMINRSIWRSSTDDIWVFFYFPRYKLYEREWQSRWTWLSMLETKWQRKENRQYSVYRSVKFKPCVCVRCECVSSWHCHVSIGLWIGKFTRIEYICHLLRQKLGGDERKKKQTNKKHAETGKILLPIFHLFGFRLIGFSVYYYRFAQFSVPHKHTHTHPRQYTTGTFIFRRHRRSPSFTGMCARVCVRSFARNT